MRDGLFSEKMREAMFPYQDTQPIKVQDANESPPESWAQSAQVMGIQKKEWVDLTDEEIDEGAKQSWVSQQAFESAVWWAMEALKEKNT
jgi:hypothetical protein